MNDVIRSFTIISILFFFVSAFSAPVEFVNPFIGTGKYEGPSKWGFYGGTYPGSVVPFGMVQLTPETRSNGDPKGYYYEDDHICCFSLADHMSGYPSGSAGLLKFMPMIGTVKDSKDELYTKFSHKNEKASPGYYVVQFDNNIVVKVTSTERTGFAKIDYPEQDVGSLVFWDIAELEMTDEYSFQGKSHNYFFFGRFEQAVNVSASEKAQSYRFDFGSQKKHDIKFKIAVSQVSIANAKLNLLSENSHWNFQDIKRQAEEKWNSHLGKVEIKGGSVENKTVFYTALYHSFLVPFISSDINGQYRGLDGHVYKKSDGAYYTGFSPWDTFRTLHPLLTLLEPDVQGNMIKSLLLMYEHSGQLVAGPMTGNHAIPVIVDSYFKGIKDFDIGLAYKAMKSSIYDPPYSKPDFQEYIDLGYVPAQWPESVTRTLEYAYNDWTLAEFAKSIDKSEHADLKDRAYNYRNVFNPDIGLMAAKNRDGSWNNVGGFIEGDEWNYSWFVPHNIQDLMNLMGGKEAFTTTLDYAFDNDLIIHDNEAPINFGYLFNYSGKAWKTQKTVRRIMNYYSASPEGIPGNDDLGSMSSWFVFSAMGFYPVCPGQSIYDINTPLFPEMTIHLYNCKDFIIRADHVSENNMFIQAASLNNKPLLTPWITHKDILRGGILQFQLGDSPNYQWPSKDEIILPSMTTSQPDFVVKDIILFSKDVKPNEQITISVKVENNGAEGCKKLDLHIDGKFFKSELLYVNRGRIESKAFSLRLYKPGKHKIQIDALPPLQIFVNSGPGNKKALFEYQNFQIDPIVKLGDTLNASVHVKNISAKRSGKSVVLYRDSVKCCEKRISLEPGESKTVIFEKRMSKPGISSFSISDTLSQRVKIYKHPLQSSILELNFDQMDGTCIADLSGLQNKAHYSGDVKFVSGKTGHGIRTGKNGFIEITESPGLNKTGPTLSIMAWIYPENETVADFISKGDYHVLKMQNPSTLNFFVGGWGRGECTAPVPSGWNSNWHHLAGVCDGTDLRLYIDGELVGHVSVAGPVESSPFPWNICRNAEIPVGRHTNGIVDDVRIYVEALSQDDIKKIMLNEDK